MTAESGKLLELHMAEGDRYESKPLYEAIVARCRELNIAGVTVFRGLEGYGPTAEIHRTRLLSKDQPIVILIVEQAGILDKALASLTDMMGSRLTVISDVEMKRVQKSTG